MSNTEFYLEASDVMRQAMDRIIALGLTEQQRKALDKSYAAFEDITWECANTPDKE